MKAPVLLVVVAVLTLGAGSALAGQPRSPGGASPGQPVPPPTASAGATATPGSSALPGAAASGPPAPPTAAPAAPRAPAPVIDRSTPRQTVAGFLLAVDDGRLDRAVRYLDLRGLRWDLQRPEQAARQLADALRHRLGLDVSLLADVPEGDPADGADVERIGTVPLADRQVPITLERVRVGSSSDWLFSRTTVARIPELGVITGPDHWLQRVLPEAVASDQLGPLWSWQWIGLLLALLVAFPLGHLLARLVLDGLARLARRTPTGWDDAVIAHTRQPARFAIGWLAAGLFALSLLLPPPMDRLVHLAVNLPLILIVGWILVAIVRGFTHAYLDDLPEDREMKTRGLRTQVVLLRKLATVAIGLVTAGVVLMQFDVVRSVGLSLLASAGVAGVALGIAAQKSLGAVIAGLQISITQPIRLRDIVIFAGEWGEVEEIALTYVRIKTWDERRLIVPVEKFLTESFQNWSKPGTEMIGAVEIAVDPTMPIDRLRAEFQQIAADHPLHDGRKCVVQVTDVNEHRALIRALISTSAVSDVFSMRCEIRERIMKFVQELEGGRYLARQRWQPLSGTDPTPGTDPVGDGQ